ncbi:MAG: response regulator [Bdellovibrionia bacterium]
MMKRYKEFFSQQRILIADDSSVSRISIARGLTELGALSTTISIAESYEAAKSLIASQEFTILMCELDIGSDSGLGLLQALKKKSTLKVSAIITKNQTDAAAALAAENDVDLFLRKPFSMEAFKQSFEALIRSRLNLNDPEDAIGSAIERLQRARNKKRVYDKVGYRALVQMFETLLSEGQKSDAYVVLRRLIMTYPILPERLNMAMRLAVESRNFDDVDAYYQFFLEIDSKSEDLIRHTYAALVASGKASLREGNLAQAMKRFKQASLTSGKRAPVLNEAILALIEAGYPNEADSFLTAYPQHERQSAEFLAIDYLVMSKLQPLHLVLQRGRELIRNKEANALVYGILIEACKKAGHHAEAESLALDAGRYWPSASADAYSPELSPPEHPSV